MVRVKLQRFLGIVFIVVVIGVLIGVPIKNMSVVNWGLLAKSEIDPEKIEEAINRLIAEHEADPDSHLGAGESLQSHRASEIIDHARASIVADKVSSSNTFFQIPVNSADDHDADNYSSLYPGFMASMNQNSPLTGDATDFLVSFLPEDWLYNYGDIVLDFILSGSGAAGTWQASFRTGFAIVEIKQGYYRLGHYSAGWTYTDWIALQQALPSRWRIFYNAVESKLNFYRNGSLVLSLDYTLDLEDGEIALWFFLNRGTSASSGIFFGDIRLAFDTTLI